MVALTVALVLVPWLGGILSAAAMRGESREWYDRLLKAPWQPPSWVFGPVWTILYILIGWSSVEFMIAGGSKIGWIVYFIQIILNWLWSPLFFGFRNITLALVDNILLWSSIVLTMYFFAQVSTIACVLLIPYILWVTIAVSLSVFIYLNN